MKKTDKQWKVAKDDSEWAQQLTREQYQVCRKHATERAFSGEYDKCTTAGTYRCVACNKALFSSEAKFDSGTGWPSFYQPIADDSVGVEKDRSLFMVRTEVHCNDCGSHLGHVFDDGPQPTGLRYCMNSVSLTLDTEDG